MSNLQSGENNNTTSEPSQDESTIPPQELTPIEETMKPSIPREWKHNAIYLNKLIIKNPKDSVQIRASLRRKAFFALVSQIEPTKTNKVLENESLVVAKKENWASLNEIKFEPWLEDQETTR